MVVPFSVSPVDPGGFALPVSTQSVAAAAVAQPERAGRSITIAGRTVPVVGPRIRDPRLHLSSVVLSVIVVGTFLLQFRLSVPHIVISVAVCGAVEAVYLLLKTGSLVWPASGMQTGTSTVIVLRVVGVEHGHWWTFEGLHWFLLVGVFGLLTKYTIRTRRGHVFNPSNVALVLAFVVFGAQRLEPLDYWWGPFDASMALAYGIILVGGVTLCARVGMLRMAAAFWLTLAVGVAVLAALGHSMTTRWSFAPVEDWHLWRTIVLSPETLVFVFFMITDPKTTPRGPSARVAFGVAVGVMSTVLLAPWSTEFGSKVGLLGGLTVMSVGRFALEPALTAIRARGARATRRGRRWHPAVAAAAAAGVVFFGATVAVAGAPNRAVDRVDVDEAAVAKAAESLDAATLGAQATVALPPIEIAPDVAGLSAELATADGAEALVRALLFNLQVEAEALTTGDAGLLTAVDHGQRLIDMAAAVDAAQTGTPTVSSYRFDSVAVSVVFPGGLQSGPNAGVTVTGSVVETTLGAGGAPAASTERPLATMFTLRRTSDGTWLTTGTLPP